MQHAPLCRPLSCPQSCLPCGLARCWLPLRTQAPVWPLSLCPQGLPGARPTRRVASLHLASYYQYRTPNRRAGQEYVLPFVLERKSSPDLLASIKDGRYLQQKWRMLSSGLPHRWYLVETAGDGHMSERDKRVGGWAGGGGDGGLGK